MSHYVDGAIFLGYGPNTDPTCDNITVLFCRHLVAVSRSIDTLFVLSDTQVSYALSPYPNTNSMALKRDTTIHFKTMTRVFM